MRKRLQCILNKRDIQNIQATNWETALLLHLSAEYIIRLKGDCLFIEDIGCQSYQL